MRKREPSRVVGWAVRFVDTVALWFPGLLTFATLGAWYQFANDPTPLRFAGALLLPYFAPLGLYRLVCLVSPIGEGGSVLAKGVWSSWFLSYRLQILYVYFPFLERLLLTVPGLFSLWLRAWGSRIGRRVNWAGEVEIHDRGHVEIGDDVFCGHKLFLAAHVVGRRKGRGVLYVRRIVVGSGAFIGSGVRMGPGVVVEAGANVPLLTDLYVRERFPKPTNGPLGACS